MQAVLLIMLAQCQLACGTIGQYHIIQICFAIIGSADCTSKHNHGLTTGKYFGGVRTPQGA